MRVMSKNSKGEGSHSGYQISIFQLRREQGSGEGGGERTGEWWNGSRANRKSSPGNSAQPIDFRARNDQYPPGVSRRRGRSIAGGGPTGGLTESIHCFEGDRGRARVPAHRPAGRREFWRVDASLCSPRDCVRFVFARLPRSLVSPFLCLFLSPSFLFVRRANVARCDSLGGFRSVFS